MLFWAVDNLPSSGITMAPNFTNPLNRRLRFDGMLFRLFKNEEPKIRPLTKAPLGREFHRGLKKFAKMSRSPNEFRYLPNLTSVVCSFSEQMDCVFNLRPGRAYHRKAAPDTGC
jgi:hypothetical protein